VLPTAPENSEMVIEVYYRLMAEDGKLQISPMAQVILDPGAGTFTDDTLFMVGLRVHVPF
jgi:carbohydrate-selective porin OprB